MQLLKVTEHYVYIGGSLEEIKGFSHSLGFEITDTSYNLIEGDLPDFPIYGDKITTYWLKRGDLTATIRKWSPDLWCVGLPYSLEFIPDDGWFVAVPEMPGCMSVGDTKEDAQTMIRDAIEGWIGVCLEDGDLADMLNYGGS